MFMKVLENKDYYLTGIERNKTGFYAYIEKPNGSHIVVMDYSSITEKFYYPKKSHKMPKCIEKAVLDIAKSGGYAF